MSLFNQTHYYTNYCVFSVVKCCHKGCCIVFRDFMSLVKTDQILSLFNQAPYYTNYCVFSVANVIIRAAVLFSEILRFWLNVVKFRHYLAKPITTRVIMYLVFENVIIRTEIIVFRDFMTLVK